jgi:hypothetical protein
MRDNRTLTTGEIARLVGEPLWRVRRVIDFMGLEIQRAGQYRLVPADLLPQIKDALSKAPRRDAQEISK